MPMNLSNMRRNRSFSELFEWAARRIKGLATARLRILPDFIIIGAQRCGTTSLYQYLSQHPEVYPSFPKEVHYFSNYFDKGTTWYRSHFPLESQKRKAESKPDGRFTTGEASPYYLVHPHAARRASMVVPQARLIVLLRDPVQRAYSHYYHEVRMGAESLSFEAAIQKEEERLDHELERMIADEHYRSFNFQHYSYIYRGIYYGQVQAWLQYYPPASFLFLNSHELDSDPASTFGKVTDFLGLRYCDRVTFKRYHASANPQMEARTREQLSRYFQPHNQKLSELIGMNFKLDQ
jgi:hypothetical protein